MADSKQVTVVRNGADAWNHWRETNGKAKINLSGVDFRGEVLRGANLREANLSEANLSGVDLIGADLREANLREANLSEANLSWADLRWADLSEANLSRANAVGANLTDANLESAKFQRATLDGAIVTGVRLWETQRSGWSIQKIVCEWACWGPSRTDVVQYASGEFEKLHSEQSCIKLLYKDGITKFQLNTLPLLLFRLTEENPGSTVRLSRIEEAAGGTKVVISVEEGDVAALQVDILKIQELQIEASVNKQLADRMENLLKSMTAQLFETALPRMVEAAAMKQNNFNGPVGNYIEGGFHHRVTSNQALDSAIQEIAAVAQRKSSELGLSAEDSQKLQSALANLNQQHAPSGIIQESLLSVRHILEHAVGAMIGHEAPVWLPEFFAKVEMALRSFSS